MCDGQQGRGMSFEKEQPQFNPMTLNPGGGPPGHFFGEQREPEYSKPMFDPRMQSPQFDPQRQFAPQLNPQFNPQGPGTGYQPPAPPQPGMQGGTYGMQPPMTGTPQPMTPEQWGDKNAALMDPRMMAARRNIFVR